MMFPAVQPVFAVLLHLLVLHPGHSTRIELHYGAENHAIEMAMRIDVADLEAALSKRRNRPTVIESLSDEEAESLIGNYLRATIVLDECLRDGADDSRPTTKISPATEKGLSAAAFRWIGWERRRASVWVYAEILLAPDAAGDVNPVILTLYEVEPDLNHVVTVRDASGSRAYVLSKEKSGVKVPLVEAAPR